MEMVTHALFTFPTKENTNAQSRHHRRSSERCVRKRKLSAASEAPEHKSRSKDISFAGIEENGSSGAESRHHFDEITSFVHLNWSMSFYSQTRRRAVSENVIKFVVAGDPARSVKNPSMIFSSKERDCSAASSSHRYNMKIRLNTHQNRAARKAGYRRSGKATFNSGLAASGHDCAIFPSVRRRSAHHVDIVRRRWSTKRKRQKKFITRGNCPKAVRHHVDVRRTFHHADSVTLDDVISNRCAVAPRKDAGIGGSGRFPVARSARRQTNFPPRRSVREAA